MRRMKVGKALPWAVVDAGTTAFTAILGLLVLSRLLSPADFGVVALAQSIVATIQIFASGGIREAVMLNRPVDVAYRDSAHWLAVILGLAGFVLCNLIAGAFQLGGQTLLATVLAASSATLVFAGFNILPDALLARRLRTAALAKRTMLAKAVYTVAACGLAFAGWGPWSIVLATVLQSAVSTVSLWAGQPRLPRLRMSLEHVRRILSFGWAISAEVALWSLTSRGFAMMVGFVHGVQVLGYVNLALRTTEVFSSLLAAINGRFALPLFANAHAQAIERVRRIYGRTTELLNLASAPIFVGLALTAPDWTPIFLGEKWLPAVPLIQAFAMAWAIVFVRFQIGDCIRVTAHPRANLPLAVLGGVAMVGAVILTAGRDMLWLALAWAFARTIVTWPFSSALLTRHAGIGLGAQFRPLLRPFVAVAAMTAAILGARLALPWGGQSTASGLRLAGDIGLGALVYAVAAGLMFRGDFSGAVQLLPPRLRKRLSLQANENRRP